MNVKVLGTGCPNCQRLEALVKEAAAETDFAVEVEKITDVAAIMSYGVMSNPGLVVDGAVRSTGRVPSKMEIVGILREAASSQ